MVARSRVPWADERFAGWYNNNKVSYMMTMDNLGLEFAVHPRAFLVHAPHPKAPSYKNLRHSKGWRAVGEIYEGVKLQMAAGTYIPVARYSCGDHRLGPRLSAERVAARDSPDGALDRALSSILNSPRMEHI